MGRTALICIATSERYLRHAERMIASAKYFLPSDVFLFTDATRELTVSVHKRIQIKPKGWPRETLMRYHTILMEKDELSTYDHIFYCDADMVFVDKVRPEAFTDGIVAVKHPGFSDAPKKKMRRTAPAGQKLEPGPEFIEAAVTGTPEHRSWSTAFIGKEGGNKYYVCGGFQGGGAQAFLEMCEILKRNVDIDESNGVVAWWHDESHFNWYVHNHLDQVTILSPSYCYPTEYTSGLGWEQTKYKPVILAIAKNVREDADPRMVSIVIPLYNKEKYIAESIESALAQTYPNKQIIVVDDGSTDDSYKIADKYASHIMLLRRQNGGLSMARNTGFVASHGEMILPLDADDILEPTYLEETVPVMLANPRVAIVSTYYQQFGLGKILVEPHVVTIEEEKNGNGVPVCSLVRRKALEQTGGYCPDLRAYEDWNLWIEILKRGWEMAVVPKKLWNYRMSAGSLITTCTPERHAELIAKIRSMHPELYQ